MGGGGGEMVVMVMVMVMVMIIMVALVHWWVTNSLRLLYRYLRDGTLDGTWVCCGGWDVWIVGRCVWEGDV